MALSALFVAATGGTARGQSSAEWLYGVTISPGCCMHLERLNLATANPELSLNFNGSSIGELCWGGNSLLSYYWGPNPDRLAAIHPANGNITIFGSTGINNNTIGRGVERNPVTGTLYVHTPLHLYTADPQTAAVTLVAPFTGFKATWDSAIVMGIDRNGSAFVLGENDGNTRHAYYELDLATAQLTWIADLIVPGGMGWFLAVAVSETGEIWMSYEGSALTPNARGLYRIDPSSFGVTMVRATPDPYYGLAFVPANTQATYCIPKTSSIGCAPTITADGFPSPTASSGYTIRAAQVRNETSGTLAYSLGVRSAIPFGGGTLCIAPPLRRTGARQSGGSPTPTADCSGAWQVDFNAWMAQNVALPAGTTVRAQWLGRDPGFPAPNNWSLSDALEFDLRP